MKIIKRRVSMIFHSENYGCQIGTGVCETYAQFKSIREDSRQLWKIKFYVDSARKNFEQAQRRTSHKQNQEI